MVTAGYKQTEVGEIPEDWEVSDILEIAQIVDGDRGANYPSKSDLNYDGYCLFLNAGNVTKLGFRFENCEFVSQERDELLSKGKLVRGDIALTTRGSIGNFAFYSDFIPYDNIRINSGMVLIRNLSKKNYNLFLFYLLRSNVVGNQIARLSFGSAQPQLTVKGISTLKLLLPKEKAEQKSIADALSDVDALIGSLEKLIAKKRDIKTGTMQQLLTGKKRLPGFGEGKATKQSELGEIPEDWDVRTYGNTFSFLSTASNSRSDLSDEGDISYIHYGDIHTKLHFNLDLEKQQLPKIDRSNFRNPAFLADGDVVMADASEDYEGIGKSIEVSNIGERRVISGLHTFLLRDTERHFADGFRAYLHSIPAVKRAFDTLATGLKVYGLSKNSLKDVNIPVPPFDEQMEIVKAISSMDAELQNVEKRLIKTKAIKQGMMQELLTGRTRLV